MRIYCHPANVSLLSDKCKQQFGFVNLLSVCFTIFADENIPIKQETGRIIFPKDRFVEYEPSDEPWALALGLAHKETEPVFYLM